MWEDSFSTVGDISVLWRDIFNNVEVVQYSGGDGISTVEG